VRITKYPASNISSVIAPGAISVNSSVAPFTLVSEAQLTVGAAPAVVIATPAAGTTYTFLIINRSAGGQLLRVGFAPQFAVPAGISLLLNEAVIYDNINFALSIVADAAGALADISVLSQAV